MTKFKPLLPFVTLTAMLGLSSQQALAFDFNPKIGLDGAYAFFDFEDDFGHETYKDGNGMVNPYIGMDVWQNIGLELGYQWFPKHTNNVRLGPGERALSGGAVIDPNEFLDKESHWELKAPYLGVTYNMPLPQCEKIALFAMLGGAYANLEAEENVLGDELGAFAPAQQAAFKRTFDDSKWVLTAKLGASFMVGEHLGLRAFGSWMNTSRLKIDSDQVSATTGLPAQVKANDTFMLGAGFFFTNFM